MFIKIRDNIIPTIGATTVVIACIFAAGALTLLAWNYVLAPTFNLPTINIWQAIVLAIFKD